MWAGGAVKQVQMIGKYARGQYSAADCLLACLCCRIRVIAYTYLGAVGCLLTFVYQTTQKNQNPGNKVEKIFFRSKLESYSNIIDYDDLDERDLGNPSQHNLQFLSKNSICNPLFRGSRCPRFWVFGYAVQQ